MVAQPVCPQTRFQFIEIQRQKKKKSFGSTAFGVLWKVMCKRDPRWLPRKLRKCCTWGEAEAGSPGGELVCGCCWWEGCGWAQTQGGDLVRVISTVLLPWAPASTVVNAHIFFFYEMYRKGRSEHLSIFSCLNFVLPIYLISSCSCGWGHRNQMLQSLILFLPVPVNSFWFKICALYLAMYVNTFLYFCGKGDLGLLHFW